MQTETSKKYYTNQEYLQQEETSKFKNGTY